MKTNYKKMYNMELELTHPTQVSLIFQAFFDISEMNRWASDSREQ